LGGVCYPYFILENQDVFLKKKMGNASKIWMTFLLFARVLSLPKKANVL
jgi:hypothetical protein